MDYWNTGMDYWNTGMDYWNVYLSHKMLVRGEGGAWTIQWPGSAITLFPVKAVYYAGYISVVESHDFS